MDYKAAYIIGNAITDLGLLLAAAHFGGGWAVFFILLVIANAFAYKARLDRWDGEL
jgi:sugar phosphate permease